MAEEVTQITRPAPFIEAAAAPYITDLTKAIGQYKAADLSQTMGPQFVAGLSPLQQEAISKAGGLGTYQPYLQTAASLAGPTAYQQFMSPYQRDVIGTTLQEYDIQAQKGLGGISDVAYTRGAFGGARQGVAEAEYQAASDRNRAALQAQLLQQGYGQAQQLAQQALSNQLTLAQAAPGLAGSQIAGLTTLGGLQQAQTQAGLSAQQQLLQQQMMQPLTAAQQYGSGIMGLISGYPAAQQITQQPTASPLQTALSAGATLAGIYRALD